MPIEHRPPTLAEYRELRSLAGWWPTDEQATARALENALFSVVVTEQDVVIGCGRIVGDGGLYFYIQDLIVHPACRRQGWGTALMRELMGYITAHAKSGALIGLMAAEGLEKFYERFGFRALDRNAPGMYQVIE